MHLPATLSELAATLTIIIIIIIAPILEPIRSVMKLINH